MINLNSLTKNIKDGFKAPTGDSNRETPTKGALRFNTETGKPEIYAKGRGWRRASVSEISAIYTHDNLVTFYDASNADTIGDTSDQYYSDVSLLLHMNGTDGSTTFTDSSSVNRTASNTGTSIETDQFKFGGSSAYFSGSDYLTYNSFPDFGADNFTIECWVYRGNNDTTTIMNKTDLSGPVGQLGWFFAINSSTHGSPNKAAFKASSNGVYPSDSAANLTGTTSLNTNTWYHLAVSWDGSTYKLFVDGVQEDSFSSTTSIFNSNQPLRIGSIFDNGSRYLSTVGYIDEVRITKGVARYTADFTPQTREFYPGDSVSDLTSNDIDSVYVGNVSLNSTEPKSFNWPSYASGGVVNYLQSVSNLSTLPVLNDNITVISWVKYDNSAFSSNKYHIISYLYADTNNHLYVSKYRSGITDGRSNKLFVQLKLGGSASEVISNSSLPASTGWFQVATTLSNNELKLYFNASQIGNTLTVSSSRSTSQTTLSVGKSHLPSQSLVSDMYGDIALVKVYDSALSEADITSELNYHKSTFGL